MKLNPNRWETVPGSDLANALERSTSMKALVPDIQAIYLWRRTFQAPLEVRDDPQALLEWVEQVCTCATGRIGPSRLSHYVVLESLLLQPSDLTDEKRKTLRGHLRKPRWRKWLQRYISGLSVFSPPLYVGETARLPERIKEHLNGDTHFGRAANEDTELDWPDLELHYLEVGPARPPESDSEAAKKRRTLLEMLATSISIAPQVSRRG